MISLIKNKNQCNQKNQVLISGSDVCSFEKLNADSRFEILILKK